MIPDYVLEIHAAHGCNLRCSSCGHYANSGHSGFVSVAEARRWLEPWVPRIRPARFKVTGGEPTLNPDLGQLLELCAESFPGARMELITNGFFLHQHPGLGKVLGRLKCEVMMSYHAPDDAYMSAVASNIRLLEEWGRTYGFRVVPHPSWALWTRRYHSDGPTIRPFHDGDLAGSWAACSGQICKQIFRGKLWKCARVAYLQLQKEKFPQLAPEWDPYLAYQSLAPDCTDQQLEEFLSAKEEPICGMCPAKPEKCSAGVAMA